MPLVSIYVLDYFSNAKKVFPFLENVEKTMTIWKVECSSRNGVVLWGGPVHLKELTDELRPMEIQTFYHLLRS